MKSTLEIIEDFLTKVQADCETADVPLEKIIEIWSIGLNAFKVFDSGMNGKIIPPKEVRRGDRLLVELPGGEYDTGK